MAGSVLAVLSGFSAAPEVLIFCVLIGAVPAGLTTLCLGRRTARATRLSLPGT
jgi:hypothetical protein